MFAFLIILLTLITVNVTLVLFFVLSKLSKNAGNIPETYVFDTKQGGREGEATPFYGVYKKAM